MHIKRIHAADFRRFSDLTVEVDSQPRLVVLCGPNGTGKSSLFDAMKTWHEFTGGGGNVGPTQDRDYLVKGPAPFQADQVEVEFHEDPGVVVDPQERLYVRSAYRNEPEFELNELKRAGPLFHAPRPRRLIDNDVRVSDNYQRLVSQTLDGLYGGDEDDTIVKDLRDRYIGELREAFQAIFPDLELEGPGDPLVGGTFRFRRGTVSGFHYKNLSGGEKAVFDLQLDLMVKTVEYSNTVFCIDEPDAHSNTRVQGKILDGLLAFINEQSQLWIATHSIGMMRRARELQEADPNSVAFFDFEDQDFDQPVTLEPIAVDRAFWGRTLGVALGDLAKLVAPARVVLCEGKPADGTEQAKAEFDARCYRAIFGDEMPDTDFLSVGNERDVRADTLQVGRSIQTLISGTNVIHVVDRDHRSPQEVQDLEAAGKRVLSRRHLESFLLDDEVLRALCASVGKDNLWPDVEAAKQQAHQESVQRGRDEDDWKAPSGPISVACRTILGLTEAGNTREAFLADTIAPLVKPEMNVYAELRRDIFNE